MKKTYSRNEVHNPLTVLRRAGYSPFKDPQTGEESFIIRLTKEFYPRFHLYVEESREKVTINLHLDQKKPSYGEGHAHAGEYDGPTIDKEFSRIEGWIRHEAKLNKQAEAKIPAPQGKGFFAKLFKK